MFKLKDRISHREPIEEKRFTLRMDGNLFNDISVIAKANRRSVAKEIECAIADYVEQAFDEELASEPNDFT